jgi:glycosyltransferase involved in cell wall biosynthesis
VDGAAERPAATLVAVTVSALIRAREEVEGIGPLLDRLRAQTVPVEPVVNSGSTDGTLAAVRSRGIEPLLVDANAFSYGRALNLSAVAASGDVLIAISAHAVPPDAGWAAGMAAAVDDGRVVAAFGERLGSHLRSLHEPLLQDGEHAQRHPFDGYSNAAGAFRRELWRRRPFDESLAASVDEECTFRRARGDLAATRTFRPVPRVRAREALREWWRRPHAHASLLRARLDPRRAAMLAGKWAALR